MAVGFLRFWSKFRVCFRVFSVYDSFEGLFLKGFILYLCIMYLIID